MQTLQRAGPQIQAIVLVLSPQHTQFKLQPLEVLPTLFTSPTKAKQFHCEQQYYHDIVQRRHSRKEFVRRIGYCKYEH